MRKRFLRVISLLLAAIMLCTAFVGCSKPADDSDGTTDGPRTVVDMLGNEVELPEQVDKIMMHWASGVTLAMTLGAVDRLSVIPEAFDTDVFAWARTLCPQLNDVEKSTEAFKNTETALTYDPDVIIANDKEIIEKFTQLGVPAVYVELTDYESYKKALLVVGEVLGEDEYARAKKYNAYFDANVNMVKERLADVTEDEKQTVYYLDTRFGDAYHTVGTGEIQGDWIEYGGGKLATEGVFEGRNIEITVEKFLTVDPDVILVGGHMQEGVWDLLMNDPLLQDLSALKNDKVYHIPYGVYAWCREGAEAALQIVWVAKLLHPDKFADVDMKQVALDFYKEFYGADLTDAQIDAIMNGKLA